MDSFFDFFINIKKKQVEEILYSPFDPSITFNYYFYQPFFNISYYPVFLYSFGYLIDFQKNLQWGVANLLKNNSHISQHMFVRLLFYSKSLIVLKSNDMFFVSWHGLRLSTKINKFKLRFLDMLV
jgi:hypothetical protein